jgi:uncharacterized phiE125 gp8 family phage protein
MTARLITPPTGLPVTLDEAKANMGIDGTDQDAVLTAWIMGVTAYAEQMTHRAIMQQGWRVTLDAFPDAIRLEAPKLLSVQSVNFVDAAGADQVLDPADYRVDTVSEPGYIVPARGKAWPVTYDEINAVSVDYTCGYGNAPADVPAGIRLFILAKLREQFDPAVRVEKDTVQATFIDRLLDQYVVYA